MGVHADGSGVEDCVERFGAQSEARDGLAADGASEFASFVKKELHRFRMFHEAERVR